MRYNIIFLLFCLHINCSSTHEPKCWHACHHINEWSDIIWWSEWWVICYYLVITVMIDVLSLCFCICRHWSRTLRCEQIQLVCTDMNQIRAPIVFGLVLLFTLQYLDLLLICTIKKRFGSLICFNIAKYSLHGGISVKRRRWRVTCSTMLADLSWQTEGDLEVVGPIKFTATAVELWLVTRTHSRY